jgi:hypothetical protein
VEESRDLTSACAPAGDDAELVQIRQELEQLARWRRLFGFSAADDERYWELTRRENQVLHASATGGGLASRISREQLIG